MSDIDELIPMLTPSEVKGFVQYLKARNKRHDTKNTNLFRALLNKKELSIKHEIGENAYNVLRKRLTDRLLDFMAASTFEADATEEIVIMKQLLIARKLLIHQKYKLAFKILGRAERNAIALQHYSLLSEIYHSFIEHSYHDLAPDQEMIFKKFEVNQQNSLAQEKINMVYAVIKKAFNEAEFNSEPINLEELLRSNFEKYGISDKMGYTYKTLYQIAHIADITGSYTKNYHSVDVFYTDIVDELEGGSNDTEKFLLYHIDVLYIIANIFFRKKEFKRSMTYLDRMYQQMQRFDNKFMHERLPAYTTLMSLNLNFNGEHLKAGGIIDELIQLKQYKLVELLNPYLSRVMIYFQQGELTHAAKILSRFHHSDLWYEKNIGLEWTLNRKYVEILLHIELGNYDYVDSRISSLLRKYGAHFKTNQYNKVLPFLKLVKKYYHNPEIVTTPEFRKIAKDGISDKSREEEDIFLMSFFAWLKSKMENKNLYETTLEMVN